MKGNSGIEIGIKAALLNLGATTTVIIPIISVLPGALIESIIANLIGKEPYFTVGLSTLGIFLIIFIISFLLIIKVVKGRKVSNLRVIVILLIEFFIIHPLAFYLYWGIAYNFKSDGQLILLALFTFPFSGLGFIGLGAAIDFLKLKN